MSLFIVVLYTTCVVVLWQLNSPLLMEEDWKSQPHRSLMAAVRAFLTARSIQLATDYRRYKEQKNFLVVHPGTSAHRHPPTHTPTHPHPHAPTPPHPHAPTPPHPHTHILLSSRVRVPLINSPLFPTSDVAHPIMVSLSVLYIDIM